MILNRKFYSQMSFLKAWWSTHQFKKLKGEKLFKIFKLHKTEWPARLYFYSPRLKRRPVFTGNSQLLATWKEAKSCETICPTGSIQVSPTAIIIDERGCIACGLCVELAPEGLLEVSSDLLKPERS